MKTRDLDIVQVHLAVCPQSGMPVIVESRCMRDGKKYCDFFGSICSGVAPRKTGHLKYITCSYSREGKGM